ncbi:hypothetical protein CL633_04360 [bacterium]|nr:hypothetical protein [bacterium]|tara:strand:+ start:9157 stop:9843 length:687 start_codon:yes stop_codon:yes gene_type:complete
MNILQTWGEVTVGSLQSLWSGVIGFLPSLLGALIVLIVGWIVAIALGRLAAQILRAFRIDQALDRIGLDKSLKKAGAKISASNIVGQIVTWFLVIVFVMAAADILSLQGVNDFLKKVLYYIPNIIVAIVILLAAVLVSNFLARLVKSSVKIAGFVSSDALSEVTKWAILIFGLLAALDQLGVAQSIINTLITGVVYMIVIAGGLAFGLGGKDQAAGFLKKLRRTVTED